jgi:hypothetical protein
MSATRAFMIVRSGAGVVLFGAERCGDVGSNPGDMLGPAARGRGLPCAPHVSLAPRSLDCAICDDVEFRLEVVASLRSALLKRSKHERALWCGSNGVT